MGGFPPNGKQKQSAPWGRHADQSYQKPAPGTCDKFVEVSEKERKEMRLARLVKNGWRGYDEFMDCLGLPNLPMVPLQEMEKHGVAKLEVANFHLFKITNRKHRATVLERLRSAITIMRLVRSE